MMIGKLGPGMRLAKARQDIEPGHARHLDVEQDEVVRRRRPASASASAPSVGGRDEIAPVREPARQRIPIGLVVVDNEQRASPGHWVTALRQKRLDLSPADCWNRTGL